MAAILRLGAFVHPHPPPFYSTVNLLVLLSCITCECMYSVCVCVRDSLKSTASDSPPPTPDHQLWVGGGDTRPRGNTAELRVGARWLL
jgi:hypothetical protein